MISKKDSALIGSGCFMTALLIAACSGGGASSLNAQPAGGNTAGGSGTGGSKTEAPDPLTTSGSGGAQPIAQQPGACIADAECASGLPETDPAGCARAKCEQGTCTFVAIDYDQDGEASSHCLSKGAQAVRTGLDCDDFDRDISSATIEGDSTTDCNGRDDDCDGKVDEDIPLDMSEACTDPPGLDAAVDTCVGAGFRSCENGTMTGCSARAKQKESDTQFCDGKSHDCDGSPDTGCPCGKAGTRKPCDAGGGCEGWITCTAQGFSACQKTNPNNACVCVPKTKRACTNSNGCKGYDTCGADHNWKGSCDTPDCACNAAVPAGEPCMRDTCGGTRTCVAVAKGIDSDDATIPLVGAAWGECNSPKRCPAGFTPYGTGCRWEAPGQHLGWGQYSAPNDSTVAGGDGSSMWAVPSPIPGFVTEVSVNYTPSQRSDQCCATETHISNSIYCEETPGAPVNFRAAGIADNQFSAAATATLTCPVNWGIGAWKGSWGVKPLCTPYECARGINYSFSAEVGSCRW